MKLFFVVGARPQFVKLAPICRALDLRERAGPAADVRIVHTGQHYDRGMSDVFFEELGIPEPDWNLGIGSGTHGAQTARMLERLEQLFVASRPDVVVVFGDTNSTLAGALAAVKLGIPVVHVEAGLRSFNRAMPEEINRVATDHVSDVLLAPTATAMEHLAREGLAARSRLVGDVMYDAAILGRDQARRTSTVIERLGLQRRFYAVATIHRAENTAPKRLTTLLGALSRVANELCPIVLPLHPRSRAVLSQMPVSFSSDAGVIFTEPLPYLDMLALVDRSTLVLTDSGGLQKEAFILGRPCVTLRDETEWTETVHAGANTLTGSDPAAIRAAVERILSNAAALGGAPAPDLGMLAAKHYGEGHASRRIVDVLLGHCASVPHPAT